MSASERITFYSASGEAVSFEDAVPDGTVSLALKPSITVDVDDQEVVRVLEAREATGWVTRTKPKTKKEDA